MKVKFFINWQDEQVYSEKELQDEIKRVAGEYLENTLQFQEWLEEHYTIVEVFNLDEDGKKDVLDKYSKACQDWAKEDMEDAVEEKTLDI